MSHSAHPDAAPASVFGALGDPTRLALVARLARGERHSISTLAGGSALTRQAITKHLRVLETAGLVRNVRHGRESLFELERHRLDDAKLWLDQVSAQWDEALERLRRFVEE